MTQNKSQNALKQWLKKNKITQEEFAVANDFSLITISRIARNYGCFRNSALRIEKITKGEVKAKDLLVK